MLKSFPLSFDDFDHQNTQDIVNIFKSKKYTMGKYVEKFEKKIAKWLGIKNAIMVNSGSSANLLLITSLLYRTKKTNLLKRGDEILLPALSWPTTIWPIIQLGLKPVLTDIDINSLAIDLKSAKKMLSKKTKAMFLIHVMGQACNMDVYKKFCLKNKLILLEDCCESFGAFYKKKSVGSFGYGGTLSHYFSHHLPTIEGGTILTNNNALANDLKSLRSHGWIRDRKDKIRFKIKDNKIDKRWLFVLPGYNVRPTEIQGKLGINQLGKIKNKLNKRDLIVKKIHKIISNSKSSLKIIGDEFVIKKKINMSDRQHSWMNIPILITSKKIKTTEVIKIFENLGIETRPIISGNITKHPVFKKLDYKKDINLKNTNIIHKKGFLIGCHDSVTNKNFNQLQKAVNMLELKNK